MTDAGKTDRFRALHQKGAPFIIANAWDAGSARILQGLGFKALATTSSGFAMSLGRRDYGVSRDEAIAHGRALAGAVDIPVSADLENGFGPAPEDASLTIRQAAQAGLAGGSIEDASGDERNPIYDLQHAVERIAAAVEAARETGFVLTARAEAYLHGKGDLDETITRLKAFEEAGADVLFAPGLPDMDALREICGALSKPVNALVLGGLARHRLEEFAEAGAARLSIGGALAGKAYATLADAAAMLTAGGFDCLKADPEKSATVSAFLKSG